MVNVPDGLMYAKTHEWVRIENGIAIVGISDFAQQQLTDIVYVDMPKQGKKVKNGETLLSIESVKSAEDVFSPVTGVVESVNTDLDMKPELINSDPYGSWIVRVKLDSEPSGLMNAGEYRKFIGEQ
ncbi:MAG: glycine cleavage system protein GcvH [Candidatus Thermoplasmatota archaeon]|jgi:glycine cleavage system H protein|nr:glycine cleavage system protein GcvH [Candidatus Thermoplasmatota archaeon]